MAPSERDTDHCPQGSLETGKLCVMEPRPSRHASLGQRRWYGEDLGHRRADEDTAAVPAGEGRAAEELLARATEWNGRHWIVVINIVK